MDSELQPVRPADLQKDNLSRKRGRPPKNDSSKKIRQTITLDPGTWEKICEIAKDLGYEGGSPFINDIGSKLSVTLGTQKSKSDEVFNIGDIPRIFSCLESPSSRLWSALSFIRSTCLALGLTQNIYENESLVEDVARKAMLVLCLRSFFEPDNYIGNITGYMNWISWHILQAKSGLTEAHVDADSLNLSLPKSKEEEISSDVWRLVSSIELLRTNYPEEYSIFQMYMMERFSNKQIAQILELRQNGITKEDASNKVKNVMHVFRKAWHNEASKNFPSQEVISEWKEKSIDVLTVTQKYLTLMRMNNGELREELNREDIEKILLVSINRPLLDTFIREIDHAYGHNTSNGSERYNECQERIRINLISGENSLSKCFVDSLNELKSILVFSGSTRLEIYRKFMAFIREQTKADIPESYFLRLKKLTFEEPVMTSEISEYDKKQSDREAMIDVCKYFTENRRIPYEKLSLEKLASNKTSVIFSCIENEGRLVCGPI